MARVGDYERDIDNVFARIKSSPVELSTVKQELPDEGNESNISGDQDKPIEMENQKLRKKSSNVRSRSRKRKFPSRQKVNEDVSMENPQNIVECSICFLTFKSIPTMRKHKQRADHPKMRSTKCKHLESRLKFECHLCSKRFALKITLQAHLFHFHSDEIFNLNLKTIDEPPTTTTTTTTLPNPFAEDSKIDIKPIKSLRQTTLDEFLNYSKKKPMVTINSIEPIPTTNSLFNYYSRSTRLSHSHRKDYEEYLKIIYNCRELTIPLTRCNYYKNQSESRKSLPVLSNELIKMIDIPNVILKEFEIKLTKSMEIDQMIIQNCVEKINCEICEMDFITNEERESHMKSVHVIYISSICGARYSSKSDLLSHYLKQHLPKKHNKCCICFTKFPTLTALVDHLLLHCLKTLRLPNDKLPINVDLRCQEIYANNTCSHCGQGFWLESCLQTHKETCQSEDSDSNDEKSMKIEDPDYVNSLGCDSSSTQSQTSIPSICMSDSGDSKIKNSSLKHPCTICGTKFGKLKNLTKHQQTYAKSSTEICDVCGTCFSSRRLLRLHYGSAHVPEISKTYGCHCRICGQGFFRRENVRIHELHVHEDQAQSLESIDNSLTDKESIGFMCDVCHLIFNSEDRYIEHTMYYSKNEKYPCSFCTGIFDGMFMLHNHNKRNHFPEATLKGYCYICEYCQEGFKHQSHYHAHILHVHPIEESSTTSITYNAAPEKRFKVTKNCLFRCNTCKIYCLNKEEMEIHQGEFFNEGYQCDECPRKLGTESLLKRHKRLTHHAYPLGIGHKCTKCNEVLLTLAALSCHEKHFHPTEVSSIVSHGNSNRTRTYSYICQLCQMKFSTKRELRDHKEELNNSGEYNCNQCWRTFVSANHIEKHLTKHTLNPTKYSCPVCKEGFFTLETLVSHDLHLHANEETRNFMFNGYNMNKQQSQIRENEERIVDLSNVKILRSIRVVKNNPVVENRVQCSICSLKFDNSKNLEKHEAKYSTVGAHSCELCDRKFFYSSHHSNHFRKHFRKEDPIDFQYYCCTCGERFQNPRSAHAHCIHFHGPLTRFGHGSRPKNDGAKFYYDAKDVKNLEGKKYLKTLMVGDSKPQVEIVIDDPNIIEINDDDSNDTVSYDCPLCKLKCPNLKFFQNHYKSIHGSNRINLERNDHCIQCVMCDQFFVQEIEFKNHLDHHHTVEKDDVILIDPSVNNVVPDPTKIGKLKVKSFAKIIETLASEKVDVENDDKRSLLFGRTYARPIGNRGSTID